jgi:3-mercaptopyruvate sulfurtransferase SseA
MILFPKKSPFPLLWCASSLLVKSASSFTAAGTPQTRSRFVTTTMAASSHSFQGKTVVSIPDAIQAHSSPNVKFVDGSWFLAGRNARDEFEQGPRIWKSHYFDIDDIATPSSSDNINNINLMHMMPTKELFAAAMDSMGISNQDHIIVYGSKDCVSSCSRVV